MRVNVGDIVLAQYGKFDGTSTDGLFLVIYHEAYDGMAGSNNFTAIKVSSLPRSYQIPLSRFEAPFLDHDSYINCSTQFRFTENNVHRIFGQVSRSKIQKVMDQLNNYNNSIMKQLHFVSKSYK